MKFKVVMENLEVKLSKGVYSLLKDYLKSNSNAMPEFNKQKLAAELEKAEVLTEKTLPEGFVSVNTKLKIEEEQSGKELEFILVEPKKAKQKLNKLSILSPIGVALAGYKSGDKVSWEMPDGIRNYFIKEVTPVVN
ncbi:GreA/GreB family elongation factor [Pseudopedobacter saltans DSM 12145]|uniref:GreA/GreB family elongation factor n=1 Tax=Pseudopedobacter saltans (strain ATCC 51119 / DSM 12145 / JCM 21818 / CCUG 39354 / LMG 10337 / NBRC 100064 / NCIMB 13643) TaxID=762903 RepID=F0S9W5_PSESL|nr:GreA/GreB family elongation factor [Pseudopedobacter saltans]ADY52523.1 GreA/GreB family elongation factor [Pseudopedobacter saltans DSM 12145]